MATTDSSNMHDFIDCFSHHIGHAALLKEKRTFQLFVKILAIVSKIPVSHPETKESW